MVTIRESQMQQMAAAAPGQQPVQPCPLAKTWVEFRLVDAENVAVPGIAYQVKLPDGSIVSGVLDQDGKARFDGIDPGQASICFTELDGREWKWQ